jgi:hypothetical protein
MTTKFGLEQETFKETTFLLMFQTLCNALFAYLSSGAVVRCMAVRAR